MNFNSYAFILVFLPIVVVLFYAMHRLHEQLGKWWLIVASFVLVGYADVRFVIFLLFSIAVNYLFASCSIVIKKGIVSNIGFVAALLFNIVILGIFKYSKFILSGINLLFHQNFAAPDMFLPLGISFITFQQIMFLVDLKKEKIQLTLSDYIFYIMYFPKLVQGPLTKYSHLIASYYNKDKGFPNADDFAAGLWFFVVGLARKVLLADFIAKGANWGYGMQPSDLTSLEAWITLLCYTLQIYFDFSGYSCMAIGISKMLSIDLADNFDTPYRAVTVSDFWKRWHISLTSFLREYIYFPLGGSRKGTKRTYINIVIIFFISGLWHGASLTFIVWGLIHGVAMCLNRLLERISRVSTANRIVLGIQWLLTFIYINITWTFFRSDTIRNAGRLLGRAFSFDSHSVRTELMQCFQFPELELFTSRFQILSDLINKYQCIPMILVLTVAFIISIIGKDTVNKFKPTIWRSIYIMILFVWSVVSLSHVTEFIYGTF